MQSQKVPVVVYEDGKRYEVGEAVVNIEGKNLAVVATVLPEFEKWILPDHPLQVSFAPVPD